MSRSSRVRLAAAEVLSRLPGVAHRDVRLHLRAGADVYVRTDTLAIDLETLDYSLSGRYFPIEAEGRVVLDLGAHKGYVAIWCLLRGSRAVYSLEPEPDNLRCLLRATVPGDGTWMRSGQGVGPEDGSALLHISTESWSHSFGELPSGQVRDRIEVEVVAFSRLLDLVEDEYPGCPTVLKLNVEGLAGDCLLSVDPERLARMEQVFLDLESTTPQASESILAHLEAAGFRLASELDGVWHLVKLGPPADPTARTSGTGTGAAEGDGV